MVDRVPLAAPLLAFSELSAGRDVNIHDLNVTLYQGVAHAELTDLRYAVKDFSRELALVDGFVGRRELFAEVAAFQDGHTCGYIRVTADAGLGKTAFAAEAARRFSAEAFFVDAGRGLTTTAQCLGHLCAVLILRFALPYDRLPVGFEDSSFFSHILTQAVDAAVGGPLWIVVDALDEAADPGPAGNVLLLPPALPAGVFVLVTQRPGVVPLRTSPDTAVADFVITSDSPDDLADLREFLTARAVRAEIADRLAAAAPPMPAEVFITRVFDASQGSFMFASFLLADIADGSRGVNAADLAALPRGLSGYYAAMWRRMAAVAERDGPEQWERLYRPAMELLAAAGEPVTADWLAYLLQVPMPDIRRRVLRAWRRFIVASGELGHERWRFVHRSFHDFLVDQDEVYLTEVHAKVAGVFADPSTWTVFDGYASRHLVMHLAGSGDLIGALELIRSHDWYAAQLQLDPTAGLIRADVTTVASAVGAANKADATAACPARLLGDEIALALYAHTFTGFRRSIHPRTLRLLVQAGVLTDAQALAMLDRDPRAGGRGRALTALIDVLRDELLDEALRIALTVQPTDDRADALLALSERMPAEVAQPMLWAELGALLERAEKEGGMLDNLGAFLAAVPRNDAIERALASVHTVIAQDTDPGRRVTRLAALVKELRSQFKIADSAAAVLRDSLERADELTPYGLTPYTTALAVLPAEDHADVLAAALPLAYGESDPAFRAASLTTLAPYAAESAVHHRVIADALAACQEIVDPLSRMYRLGALLAVAHDPDTQAAILAAVHETAPAIAHPCDLARALAPIIALSVPEDADTFLEEIESALPSADPLDWVNALIAAASDFAAGAHHDRLLHIALQQARTIPADLTRAQALLNVAINLPVEQASPVAVEAVRIRGGLLAVGEQQPDSIDRTLLLARLAQALDGDHRAAAVQLAEDLIDTENDPYKREYNRGRALAALRPVVSGPRRAAIRDELHALWDEVDIPGERTELGLAVLEDTAESDWEPLFHRVLESAEQIEPADILMTVFFYNEIGIETPYSVSPLLGRMTKALVELLQRDRIPARRQRLVDKACDAVYDTPDELQPDALRAVAPFLDITQCHRILNDYHLILSDPERRAVVESIEGIMSREATLADVAAQRDMASSHHIPSDSGPSDDAATLSLSEDSDSDETSDGNTTTITMECSLTDDHLYGLSRQPDQKVVAVELGPEASSYPPEEQREIELGGIRRWIADMAATGQPEILKDLNLAQDFTTGRHWQRAITAILLRLAELTSIEEALARADTIWPDGFPPAATATFAEYRPDDTILDALAAATDPGTRAVAIATYLRTAPPRQRARAQRTLDDAVSDWQANKPPRSDELATELLTTNVLTPTLRLRLVRHQLDQATTRQELLQATTTALQAILDAGGPGTAQTIAAAIRDISARWPP
ncbi:hypothetical protein P3H15_28290 [Rhodococcus sp. T2V]|uniref:hypothetical protein n=1 Tax=Rhodococcus sp. T2V TaxID=3034164 RepID=UPI0023E1B781|nr:hypothetical protein [Rhodococcus sp. T2V]MDF3308918.1 hypothetical protein [Rhodococcus sp. T2V]